MEYITVPRFASAFLLVLSACFLHAQVDSDSIKVMEASKSLKCEAVEGRVADCSECYECNSEAVAAHKAENHVITRLKLNNNYCNSSETLCCVSQKDMIFRESQRKDRLACGRAKHEGFPRALRRTIRSVLQGEYPWRAWIYDVLEPGTPLCAAVYVDTFTLLTTGSCVNGKAPHELQVLFDRSLKEYHPLDVKRIDVHEGYNRSSRVNDVAVLGVLGVPERVEGAERACLPLMPVPHGVSCVAVANNDYSLNQETMLQSMCNEDGKLLHPSLMCSKMYPGDFEPEASGALFCADDQSRSEIYTVYGMYLYSQREGRIAISVNVTHFTEWITNKSLKYKSTLQNIKV